MNNTLKQRWNNFEGIWTVFFEGIFTTYSNVGITGLNLPGVDFVLNGGLLSLEFRLEITKKCYSIFEKCSIYDGGARRFEQSDHIDCIVRYWRNLSTLSDNINIVDFIEEKYGYCAISFEKWKQINHYGFANRTTLETIYQREQSFIKEIMQSSLREISEFRLSMLQDFYAAFV